MTLKEALEQIKVSHFQVHIESGNIADFDIWFEDYYNLLLKALTPPTVDEVCKALSDFTGQDVLYSLETHEFYYIENTSGPINNEYFITETYGDGLWSLGVYLPPRLITLIGRFYEGLEVKE